MSDRILNIAYVGNGKSANRYHMPFVRMLPDKFHIKTVYDRHVDHSLWSEVPGVDYVSEIDAVLGDSEVDVVEVCAPSQLHYELAKQVLLAGKHVTVDKPFAATAAEAQDLFDTAAAQGVTVQCYQNRRFDSDYLTARKVVESGKLGRVFEIVTSYDYFRPEMLRGRELDVINSAGYGHAPHCIDQIISWLGEPSRFDCELRQLQGPGMANDYFDIDLYYDELGIKASAHANYMSAFQRPSFEIYGDRGAFVKFEKDQQERDLKRFYLPEGHADFGLDTLEQRGFLRYLDEDGELREERVPTVRSTWSSFYEALYETVANGAPQLVTPAQTMSQMRILEEGTKALTFKKGE